MITTGLTKFGSTNNADLPGFVNHKRKDCKREKCGFSFGGAGVQRNVNLELPSAKSFLNNSIKPGISNAHCENPNVSEAIRKLSSILMVMVLLWQQPGVSQHASAVVITLTDFSCPPQ